MKMNTAKILQQYILIKPNTLHTNDAVPQFQALRSLENAPTLIATENTHFFSKNVMPNHGNDSLYGTKRGGKVSSMSRRNARERRRVKLINLGYETLRHHVPAGIENRKLSKVDTLRSAVDYIKHLQNLLESTGEQCVPKMEDNDRQIQNITPVSDLSSSVGTTDGPLPSSPTPTLDTEGSDILNSENDALSTSGAASQKSVVKDDRMFIDLAEWLCKTSSVLHNGTIKIEGMES